MRFLILVISCSLIAATHQKNTDYDGMYPDKYNKSSEYKHTGFVPFSGVNDLPCFKVSETLESEEGTLVQLGLLEKTRYIASYEKMEFSEFSWAKLAFRWYKLYDFLKGNNENGMIFPKNNFQTSSFVKEDITNGTVNFNSTGYHVYKFFISNLFEDLPVPNDPSIAIVEESEAYMAAITVGGYPDVKDFFALRNILIKVLTENGMIQDYDLGAIIVAGFDNILKFWDRKNTVMILKKGWQPTVFLSNMTMPEGDMMDSLMNTP